MVVHRQRLYRPEPGMPDAYPNLHLVLTRPINSELIRQQYDEMVKYATALRLGTADAESILRRSASPSCARRLIGGRGRQAACLSSRI